MQNKTVAVIGGAGFVGRAVIEKLARAGARIVVLTRNAERAKILKPLGDVGQITAVAGNALNDADLQRVLAPADMVVNLVGVLASKGKQSFTNLHANLPGRIGEIAQQTDVQKIVHVSALGADLNAASASARSKAEGERNLLRVMPNASILRPSVIFGPGDGFFCRFGQMAMIAPALPLIGGGHNLMQPVYISDVAEAIQRCLEDPQTDGRIYELGGPTQYSFKKLMEMTREATGRNVALVKVPALAMKLPAALFSILPNPPITNDQLRQLGEDNIVSGDMPGFAELGIAPQPAEAHIAHFLAQFRPGGRFGR